MPAAVLLDFLLLSAIWGSSFLFTQLALPDFGAIPTAAGRVVIAAAVLLPLVLLRGHGPALRRHWPGALGVGLLNSAIPFALFAYAVQSLSTGMAAILNATVPMFGALVAWLWLGDRLSPLRLLGLLVGFAGVAVLALGQASFTPGASGHATGWAVMACLAACLCYGISASATKRHLTGVPPLVLATGSQVGATLALALPAIWFWPTRLPGTTAWLALAALGLLCTALAYILYFRLIERAGPARALTVTFLVPVFAVTYGALLLDERVTLRMLVCGAVIVLGTALATGLLPVRRR